MATGKLEWMLVAGYSGIGKTSLIFEVHKLMTEKGGVFVSGKFDQFKRNIPYSAFIQAFQDLVRQLLAEQEDRLLQWKEKIQKAVGSYGQIITI